MSDAEETGLLCVRPNCGAALAAGSRFCHKCGSAMNEQQRRTSSARMKAVRPRSESVTAPPLVDVVGDLTSRLRRERPAAGRLLIAEGEAIRAVLASTTVGDEERGAAAQAIFGWHQRTLDLLMARRGDENERP